MLDKNYEVDLLADAIHARQLELFHYEFDLGNFNRIVASLPEGDSFRTELESRVRETMVQLAKAQAIYEALLARAASVPGYAAAVKRTRWRRNGGLLGIVRGWLTGKRGG